MTQQQTNRRPAVVLLALVVAPLAACSTGSAYSSACEDALLPLREIIEANPVRIEQDAIDLMRAKAEAAYESCSTAEFLEFRDTELTPWSSTVAYDAPVRSVEDDNPA